ncbi:hypothetical protein [Streptomyces sp. CA-132043]|uniref:hypothetical protein n=1 Tax=Streptomyces sp. CA-132043 TaxID=3240048 RepID=UPI003D8F3125
MPSLAASPVMPDIRRTDASAVFISHWYVPDRAHGLRDLDDVLAQWEGAAWPAGFVSFSCFLSTDDDTVLTYAQCADAGSYRPFVRALRGPAGAEPVEYRLHRSVVLGGAAQPPGCMVTALFDIDGPERQRRIVASVADSLEDARGRLPGMVSANFHLSTDGTRVLNYAEWTSDQAHIAFLEGAARAQALRITTDMPGVRPIGYKRYHLHRSMSA